MAAPKARRGAASGRSAKPGDGTPERILEAAAELFAASGFHATSVRDIAGRARANVAAGHYHFGSKEELYLRVFRDQFADVSERLAAGGPVPPTTQLRRLSRAELLETLQARIATMLEIMIGPPPSLHAALMQREMCDPTEALPVIVREFLRPQLEDMRRLIECLAPGLGPAEVQRCLFSIGGQVLFYRLVRPVVLQLLGRDEYPEGFAQQAAAHIAEFSLGGIERVASAGRSRTTRRAG
jgi:TetR/AcrR family transcriptional regulator, regulator of cefoperazone and chloramphenicol sensitivity